MTDNEQILKDLSDRHYDTIMQVTMDMIDRCDAVDISLADALAFATANMIRSLTCIVASTTTITPEVLAETCANYMRYYRKEIDEVRRQTKKPPPNEGGGQVVGEEVR
jgi:hypothetical protein